MGFISWAIDIICIFWNGIGGFAAIDTIGRHIFNILDDIGKAISAIGK
jgi:hypothetical protein